nr:DDE-type integrase/transposase/recombinase [Desulforamulus ferrireducens]
MVLSSSDRENIALKRFSLISPILNGQVNNHKEYFEALCSNPIEMPYYGIKNYSPKTLANWLFEYRRGGIEALKPGYRSDKGKSRKVSLEIADAIWQKRAEKPRLTTVLLYEELVKEGVINPDKLSLATFYRFVSANPDLAAGKNPDEQERELKRFSHQWINELWQADILYGPYIRVGKSKKQAYLLAFLDDASRLVTHAQFFDTQNYNAMRATLREAMLKRGIPKMIYTDNGKVYRTEQLAMLCAGLGCSLIHTAPFTPTSKGKIERFFLTVRQRFLCNIDPTQIKSFDELNLLFWRWLEEDYHRKTHSALGVSPLDFFMSQAHQITLFSDPELLKEHFLLRINRKVNHDATLSVDSILYETDQGLANSRVEVRYEPEWLTIPQRTLPLYQEGKLVGEARRVNFYDNAKVKRRGRPTGSSRKDKLEELPKDIPSHKVPSSSISFAEIAKKSKEAGES